MIGEVCWKSMWEMREVCWKMIGIFNVAMEKAKMRAKWCRNCSLHTSQGCAKVS